MERHPASGTRSAAMDRAAEIREKGRAATAVALGGTPVARRRRTAT